MLFNLYRLRSYCVPSKGHCGVSCVANTPPASVHASGKEDTARAWPASGPHGQRRTMEQSSFSCSSEVQSPTPGVTVTAGLHPSGGSGRPVAASLGSHAP